MAPSPDPPGELPPASIGISQPPRRPPIFLIGALASTLVGAVFAAGAIYVLFRRTITVDGGVLSGGERAGVGAILALVAVSLVTIGYGFLRHRRWARPAALGAWALIALFLMIGSTNIEGFAWNAVWSALVVGGYWWNFYRRPSVVAYYAGVEAAERSGSRIRTWAIEWQAIPFRSLAWAALAFAAFATALLLVIETSMRRSDPYAGALELANADPRVVSALGVPVEAGLLLTGAIDRTWGEEGTSGHASFEIPIHGPRGSGEFTIRALRDSSGWRYTCVIFAAGGRVDTLGWARVPIRPPDSPSAR